MWTVCRGSEDPASWSHGWHSDAGLRSGDLRTASIITFYFAQKKGEEKEAQHQGRQAPTLRLAPWKHQAGILASSHWNILVLSQGRQEPKQLTDYLSGTHIPNSPLQQQSLVISLRVTVWQSERHRPKSEFHRTQQTHFC